MSDRCTPRVIRGRTTAHFSRYSTIISGCKRRPDQCFGGVSASFNRLSIWSWWSTPDIFSLYFFTTVGFCFTSVLELTSHIEWGNSVLINRTSLLSFHFRTQIPSFSIRFERLQVNLAVTNAPRIVICIIIPMIDFLLDYYYCSSNITAKKRLSIFVMTYAPLVY